MTFLLNDVWHEICGRTPGLVDRMNYQTGLKEDHFSLIPLLCAFRL